MFHYTSPLQLATDYNYICRDKSFPVVSTALILDIGSKDELPEQQGWAHLCEHLLLQGQNKFLILTKLFHNMGEQVMLGQVVMRLFYFAAVPKYFGDLFLESEKFKTFITPCEIQFHIRKRGCLKRI